jgi:cyclophilin family peptidyl-prolyl cis-trans isomerase
MTMYKTVGKILSVLIAVSFGAAGLALAACKSAPESCTGNTEEVVLERGDTYAVMVIRDFGEIRFKLFAQLAPVAVRNFIDLAESGYYEDKVIHRVIADFMFQGGSPYGDGRSSLDYPTFAVETSDYTHHIYGTLAMANSQGRNAQQFYVINNPNGKPHLDGMYTIFGQAVEGFEVIDAVSAVQVDVVHEGFEFCQVNNPRSRPVNAVVIESVTIGTYGE